MKRIPYFIFIISFSVFLLSNDEEPELKINAKEIYQKGFKDLKPLPTSLVNYLMYNFDNVSHWDSYQYLYFSYPLDTVNKQSQYQIKRKDHIINRINKYKFYYFPMKIGSRSINCDVVTFTDSNELINSFKTMEVYYFDTIKKDQPPIRLLAYIDYYDGLSTYTENSNCIIGKEDLISSEFVSLRKVLDLPDYDDSIPKPDTIIVKMKLKGDLTIEVVDEYNSYTKKFK